MSCNKNYFFVHLDANRHPIPSTMFSKRQAAINSCTTLIAPLTGEEMVPPLKEIQCFPTTGLRYFYQVRSIPTGGGHSRTEIVPNSMIAVKGVPEEKGTNSGGINGPGRSCRYVEYKMFTSNPQNVQPAT